MKIPSKGEITMTTRGQRRIRKDGAVLLNQERYGVNLFRTVNKLSLILSAMDSISNNSENGDLFLPIYEAIQDEYFHLDRYCQGCKSRTPSPGNPVNLAEVI
jgi:hypothetical protein